MTNAIGEMRDWAPIFRFGVEAPVGAWTLVLADAAPSRRRKGPFSAAGHPVRRGEAARAASPNSFVRLRGFRSVA